MSKINMKITVVLLSYSILVTGIFVAGILSFASYSGDDRISTYLNSDLVEIDEAIGTRPGDNIDPSKTNQQRIDDLQKYADYYHDQLMHKIAIISVFFCLFLIGSTFVLWLALRRMQKNENIRIAEQLHSIQEMNDFVSDDPILAKAFSNIREQFEHHMMDYERLHTYLSHEQKNALSLLRANLELHHEDACLKNIEDIAMGIDDLVTLSESKEKIEMKPIDIISLCADVVDTFTPHYPKLHYNFDDELLYVAAKPRWIICALHNLIDNAIKYGEGKDITITITGNEHDVCIHVLDNGIGIAEDVQKKIFDQSYRVNELNKDGYGIGLSLVMHVCKLCDGEIHCDSIPGKGSEFIMKLPRCHVFDAATTIS